MIHDQSRYIYSALHEINKHLVLGSIFASLVVFLFMRSWRTTLIAAVAIPTSVISTFGMMAALDFTLNSVTMLALVLMVGVVIDDAIVVLENIFRFIEEKGMPPFEAARAATAEIGLAVLATTLSLVVIFVPVSFMSSISGRFLYQFGLTAAVAVLVSLLVSFTLTPMMSARLLRAEDVAAGHGHGHDTARSRRGFYARLDGGYARLLAWAMGHRRTMAVAAIAVVALSLPLSLLVRREYIPSGVDEAEFDVNVNAPEGTSLAAMDEIMRAVEAEVRAVPHVRTTLVTAGGGFLGGVNSGEIYVRISPHGERTFNLGRLWRETWDGRPWAAFDRVPQREVMQQIRGRLRQFSDLRTSVRNARSFNFGGGPAELDFVLRGPDLVALAGYAEALRARQDELGLVDADTTLKLDKPELRVVIDRERAADLGVDSEEIAQALRLMVGGDSQVSRFHDPVVNDDYDVQLRLEREDRGNPATISRLWVPRSGGSAPAGSADGLGDGLVRLDNVVRIEQGQTASRIDRLDRQRQVSLRAGVAPGYRPRRPAGGAARRGRRDEPAAAVHDGGVGPRPRARAHLARVRLGLRALGALHVHDPGVAVRERGAPAHHPPLAAAVGAVRPLLAVGHRQHAQPLLGARHPGALRGGEEERHPAGGSHQPPARHRGWSACRRSCRPTATACGRS